MQPMNPSRNDVSAQQPGLFVSLRWPKARPPKRDDVLKRAEQIIPWNDLEALVRPYYLADARKTGRRGYSLKMMLHVFALQRLWIMSDRQTEAAILDSHAFARFIGTDAWAPRPPSATAIRGFRALLESVQPPPPDDLDTLADFLVRCIGSAFMGAGVAFRPGTIREPVFKATRKTE